MERKYTILLTVGCIGAWACSTPKNNRDVKKLIQKYS